MTSPSNEPPPDQQPYVPPEQPYSPPTYQQPGYGQPTYSQPGYAGPAYAQPAYPQPGAPGAGAPEQPGIAPLAVVGLVLAFLVAPIGAVISFIALGQTGRGKRRGRGLAIAGSIVGVLITLATIVVGVLLVVLAQRAADVATDQLGGFVDDLYSYQTKADVDAGNVPDFSGDIVLGAAEASDGVVSVPVTFTNSADIGYFYAATVTATSPNGATEYESAYINTDLIASGEQLVQSADFFTELPGDAVFTVSDYSRNSF